MDVVIGAFVAGSLLVFVLAALLAPGDDVSPGIVGIMSGIGVAILGVALVVLVLRMLLAQAIARDGKASQLKDELKDMI